MKYEICYIVHAYSASNSGDGLLVDLTLKNAANEIRGIPTYLVCIDPHSFRYLEELYPSLIIISLARFLPVSFSNKGKRTLVIGVGGGYLRSGAFIEGFKSLLAHGYQLLIQKLMKEKYAIYLPQSVGPFNGVFGRILKWLLVSTVDCLYCRDDKSMSEVKGERVAAFRLPDMVVSEIHKEMNNIIFKAPRKVYLVARDLSLKPYSSRYNQELKRLYDKIPECEVVIQASSRGNNDIVFCQNIFGVKAPRLLKEALASTPGIVVSVRLHGSLETILAGSQTIHLSYERKGVAAFHDLGLDDFVMHCSNFSTADVLEKIERIHGEPFSYSKTLVSEVSRGSYFDEIKEVIHA